jgi:predicted DNA-binding transcriptional regulator AlpA
MALKEASKKPRRPKEAREQSRMMMREDVARYCRMSPYHFMKHVKKGNTPQPIYVLGLPRWDRRQIDKWLDELFGVYDATLRQKTGLNPKPRPSDESEVPLRSLLPGSTWPPTPRISPGRPGTAAFLHPAQEPQPTSRSLGAVDRS